MAQATGTSELLAPTPLPRGQQTSRGRTWTERSERFFLLDNLGFIKAASRWPDSSSSRSLFLSCQLVLLKKEAYLGNTRLTRVLLFVFCRTFPEPLICYDSPKRCVMQGFPLLESCHGCFPRTHPGKHDKTGHTTTLNTWF